MSRSSMRESDLVKHVWVRQDGRNDMCFCMFMMNVPFGTLGIVRDVAPSGSIAIIEWLDADAAPTGYRPYPGMRTYRNSG